MLASLTSLKIFLHDNVGQKEDQTLVIDTLPEKADGM